VLCCAAAAAAAVSYKNNIVVVVQVLVKLILGFRSLFLSVGVCGGGHGKNAHTEICNYFLLAMNITVYFCSFAMRLNDKKLCLF